MSERLQAIAVEAAELAKVYGVGPEASRSAGARVSGEAQIAEVLSKLARELAMHPVQGPAGRAGVDGVGLPGLPGVAGPQGPPGPAGLPGRGIDDMTPAGQLRVKLQALYEATVMIHAEAREAGMSTRARRALKKARRYYVKALGGIVAEDETAAGKIVRQERDQRKAERAARRAQGEGEEQDPDDSEDDLGDDPDDGEEPDVPGSSLRSDPGSRKQG